MPPPSSGSWSRRTSRSVRRSSSHTTSRRRGRRIGLEGVAERPLTGDASLTRADLDRNAATIVNVPLWNDRPLLDTFGQIQEIRTYYDFAAVDNDRYMIDGQYRQIMLSARELNSASLPSRTWINEHLTFTHGYGLTLGPVNEVTPEGLPVLFIKDLPLASTVDLKVTQPAIYFGELQNDHVFVKTKTEEFDYPRGDANVFATYSGRGGVPLSNVFRRLMFAIRFRSTDTFFSPNLTEESRVMMYRRIAERVARIMPSLSYDPDPVSDHHRRSPRLDAGRLHDLAPLSVLDVDRRPELHPQLDQGHRRRLRRHHHLPRRRSDGPGGENDWRSVSRPPAAAGGDARDAADAAALSAADLRDPGGDVHHLPHDQRGRLLQPRGSVGDPDLRQRRAAAGADAPLLHDHEAAGRGRTRVHPDAAVHAARQGQPRGLDGRAQRRRATTASWPSSSSRSRR